MVKCSISEYASYQEKYDPEYGLLSNGAPRRNKFNGTLLNKIKFQEAPQNRTFLEKIAKIPPLCRQIEFYK